MKNWPVLALANLDDFIIDELLSCVNESSRCRAADFKSPHRLKQFLLGQLLLQRLYHLLFHTGLPSVSYEENGRPFFNDSDVTFNLSHSRDLVACGINQSGRIGVDIEYVNSKRNWKGIANECFSKEELDSLAKAEEPLNQFYSTWTIKGAVVKLLGYGIHRMSEVHVNQNRNTVSQSSSFNSGACWSMVIENCYCSVFVDMVTDEKSPGCLFLSSGGALTYLELESCCYEVY
ncbi:MAG: 4'-phosphopantetheinyl transferase superfamily protein [Desulfuromonadales bacterium]|nr:4'-phosphopantetheinyl transferase superfamily protein [Desulfuromonadales bacterium]